MSKPIRVAVVFGTRPEAIKVLPIVRAFAGQPRLRVRTVVTGQHRELLADILRPFRIRPDADLRIMRAHQSLSDIVCRAMPRLDSLYADERPDVVVVQGDTTSAFCAALAAFHRRIAVAQVEAGLRSGDRFHPYPEETNRRMISACTDLHFAPTPLAADSLRREGVAAREMIVTGNTAIDALLLALGDAGAAPPAAPLVLITLHRREAWSAPGTVGETVLGDVLLGLRRVAEQRGDVTFVYPVHLN